MGAIVVAITIAVGIRVLSESSAQANLEAVIFDIQALAARAHQYYLKSSRMGGGNKSFVGLTADAAVLLKLTTRATNENGTYSITTSGAASEVVLQGVGGEEMDGDGTRIQVWMWVRSDANDDSLVVMYSKDGQVIHLKSYRE